MKEEIEKRIEVVRKSIEKLKINQKLIMGILKSNETLTEKDLKVVKWGFDRKFNILSIEIRNLEKKIKKL